MATIERLRKRVATGRNLTDHIDISPATPFPPASPNDIEEAERRLGHALPALLREIYLMIGNGGFGPGYGLIGIDGGARDDQGHSITELYALWRQTDPDDPLWHWPAGLVPICHWGCAIYSCVDCSGPLGPVMIFDPNPHTDGADWADAFRRHTDSFEDWVVTWLDGINLWNSAFPDPHRVPI